jgi:nicotinamidase-related amidase
VETGGEAATVAAEQVLAAARRAAIPIFFTRILRSSPDGGFLPIELGRKLRDKPGLLATPPGLPDGNVVADRLQPRHGEIVISKPKPSAFFGSALDTYLNYLRVDTLIVTGMVTSGCVRATVIDGYMRNYQVVVPEEAVADYSDFQHRASLFDMHMKYADVAPVADVVEYLDQLGVSHDPAGVAAERSR